MVEFKFTDLRESLKLNMNNKDIIIYELIK